MGMDMKFNFRLVLFSVLALLILPARDADPACDLQYLWHAQGRIVKTLGVELSDEAVNGLAKVVSKIDPLDLAKNQKGFSVVVEAASKMKQFAGKDAVSKFFENASKLGDDVEGIDSLIKRLSTANSSGNIRGVIGEMDIAAKLFKGKNIEFGKLYKSNRFSGSTDLDILDPVTKWSYEVKNRSVDWLMDDSNLDGFFNKDFYDVILRSLDHAQTNGAKHTMVFKGRFSSGAQAKIKDSFLQKWGPNVKEKGLLDYLDFQFIE